jgi:hypothetical protein
MNMRPIWPHILNLGAANVIVDGLIGRTLNAAPDGAKGNAVHLALGRGELVARELRGTLRRHRVLDALHHHHRRLSGETGWHRHVTLGSGSERGHLARELEGFLHCRFINTAARDVYS